MVIPHFHDPQKKPINSYSPFLPPPPTNLLTTALFPVPVGLITLGISYTWDYTTCELLCLPFFVVWLA